MKNTDILESLNRQRLLIGITCIALSTTLVTCKKADSPPPRIPQRPNIILIIGDDHGWPYFGFMGDTIVKTPHLDQLAKEGTTFTHGFTTSSECRRSLNSLLTGLHPDQWAAKNRALQAKGQRRRSFEEIIDFQTLPGLLENEGYVSFQGGKHWEGTYEMAGFTHGMKYTVGKEAVKEFGGLMTLAGAHGLAFGRESIDPLRTFLDDQGQKPFYVWFAPMLPHTPHDAPDAFLEQYRGKGYSPQAERYYANITRFDARVGDLLDELEKRKLRKKTLLIYISDNGWEQAPNRVPVSDSLGDPKGKLSLYEMGFRTPILFSWPGVIAQGVRSNQLVSAVDLFPTCLDFAGAPTPPDQRGKSLYGQLTGAPSNPRSMVVGSMIKLRQPPGPKSHELKESLRQERGLYYRDETWRYLWYQDRGKAELYNIDTDPLETQNVIEQHPKKAERFRKEIEAWEELMEGNLP